MRKSSYKISVVVTLILQNGLSFYLPKISIYTKYFTLSYDNYDAINVDKVLHIPNDYEGIMGVPITFMNNYNPDQFEILGLSGKCGYGLDYHKSYKDYSEVIQSKKTTRKPRMGSTITGNPMMKGIDPKKSYYKKGDDIVHSLYGRIFIKNKKVVKQ